MNTALTSWFVDNCIKGFVVAAFIAATKFFVSGTHIGESMFFGWWIGAALLITITRILEAMHRANLIMEAMNKNDH